MPLKNRTKAKALAGVSTWIALMLLGFSVPTAPAQPPADGSKQHALVNQYCAVCHNQKLTSGGVSLADLDFSNVAGNADTLEKVLRKVHSGEMPPAGMPRPDASTSAGFTKWLQDELDREAAAHPNPGRPAVHRLNRAEYSNAIRDLLALDIKPGAWLPVDDSGYGFDNIGDVLSTSPVLLDRYLTAAVRVSRLAVGDLTTKPVVEMFEPPRDPQLGLSRRNDRVSDDLPFGSRGGLSVQHYVPLDGEYLIRVIPAATP